jgi:hypothetical protein
MALSTYGDLKSAITAWQYGATSLTANAADLVTLAQGYLNRRLRCREMVTQTDIEIAADNENYALPSGFLQVKHVTELATSRRRLRYLSLDIADRLYPDRESGLGVYYTIIGSNIQVFPTTSNDIELTYFAALSAFAEEDDTDWLLAKMPNLYLSAGQMYAAEFLKDDAEVQKQATIVDTYIAMLNAEADGAELVDASYIAEGWPV